MVWIPWWGRNGMSIVSKLTTIAASNAGAASVPFIYEAKMVNSDWDYLSACTCCLDADDNVIAVGCSFDNAADDFTVVMKLDPTGVKLWDLRINVIYPGKGQSVAVDENGTIFISGEMNSKSTVLKVSADGTYLGAAQVSTTDAWGFENITYSEGQQLLSVGGVRSYSYHKQGFKLDPDNLTTNPQNGFLRIGSTSGQGHFYTNAWYGAGTTLNYMLFTGRDNYRYATGNSSSSSGYTGGQKVTSYSFDGTGQITGNQGGDFLCCYDSSYRRIHNGMGSWNGYAGIIGFCNFYKSNGAAAYIGYYGLDSSHYFWPLAACGRQDSSTSWLGWAAQNASTGFRFVGASRVSGSGAVNESVKINYAPADTNTNYDPGIIHIDCLRNESDYMVLAINPYKDYNAYGPRGRGFAIMKIPKLAAASVAGTYGDWTISSISITRHLGTINSVATENSATSAQIDFPSNSPSYTTATPSYSNENLIAIS